MGRRSRTSVYVVYLKGIAPENAARQVAEKLEKIDVDALLYPGVVEEAVSASILNPFPLSESITLPAITLPLEPPKSTARNVCAIYSCSTF